MIRHAIEAQGQGVVGTMNGQHPDGDRNAAETLEVRYIAVSGAQLRVRLPIRVWRMLEEIADREKMSVDDLIALVNARARDEDLNLKLHVFAGAYMHGLLQQGNA